MCVSLYNHLQTTTLALGLAPWVWDRDRATATNNRRNNRHRTNNRHSDQQPFLSVVLVKILLLQGCWTKGYPHPEHKDKATHGAAHKNRTRTRLHSLDPILLHRRCLAYARHEARVLPPRAPRVSAPASSSTFDLTYAWRSRRVHLAPI